MNSSNVSPTDAIKVNWVNIVLHVWDEDQS